ncbi:uncharacterized protein LOC120124241 [Hibiscus syriacus]|uniref:uncharacterized protein LOC120124241 n=1 Tax=Hibiscus syriacus TaxID=106335 RepID=UPI00192296FE|nr:uncharacterized protein LOC120124241 [Hibiscus syriacus]
MTLTFSTQVFAALQIDFPHHRNKVIHDNAQNNLFAITTFIKAYLREQDSLHTAKINPNVSYNAGWFPPPMDVMEVNFDAVFDKNNFMSATGIVIRNHKGILIAAGSYLNLLKISDPCVAEATACEQAIKLARELNFRKVIIEGDSLTVIRKLQTPIQNRSLIIMIIKNVITKCKDFTDYSFRHAARASSPVDRSSYRERQMVG